MVIGMPIFRQAREESEKVVAETKLKPGIACETNSWWVFHKNRYETSHPQTNQHQSYLLQLS